MTVGTEAFFKRLEESGLLNDSIVEQKERILGAASAEDAVSELVGQNLLTTYQGEVLISGDSVPLVVGDNVVTDLIGRGGMGYVLKARHRRMKREVAIKFLLTSLTESEDLKRRFEREVEAAAQLDHQNIVTAYDAGVHEGSHYLVMQYVDGEDLSQIVKSSGPLDVPDAVDVIRQAALGLGYAHDRGIVHRDIKPGNLLLDREGVVRILDMGLARMAPSPGDALEGGAQADLTNTGSVMGTIDYMAPEQALDAKSVDHRADIYALGCTLYFLLTSNPPFRNETVMRRLLAHREEPAPRISAFRPETPDELDQIFSTMMAKSPDDRFSSMKHLVKALDGLGLNSSKAEQMATLDMPNDGDGGFISLPDNDDEETPASNTDISASSVDDSRSSLSGPATAKLPGYDATILEDSTQSPLSQASERGTAAEKSQTAPDTDFPGFGETMIGETPSSLSQSHSGRDKSQPPWKIILPLSIVFVALTAYLVTRRDPATKTLEPAASETISTSPPVATQPTASEPSDDSPVLSPDRREAVEWIVSNGGWCELKLLHESGGHHGIVTNTGDIPSEPFMVHKIGVDIRREADSKLLFEPLQQLRGLNTFSTNSAVSPKDIAWLQNSPDLESLHVHMTSPLNDDWAIWLQQFSKLRRVTWGRFGDTGLSHLTRIKTLEEITLGPPATVDGIRQLASLPNLRSIILNYHRITPDLVAAVGTLPVVQKLIISWGNRSIEQETRKELGKLTQLEELWLVDMDLDDSVVPHLQKLTRLKDLQIKGSGISKQGVEQLRKSLPLARIKSDEGDFESAATINRRAAEAVLNLGGTAWVGSDFRQVVDLANLPNEPFVVTKIDLSEKKNIEDEFLANIRGLVDLQILILSETSITDRGLANLTDEGRQPLPSLQRLDLDGTRISQTGLQFLSGSHALWELLLNGTAVSQSSVLSQFPNLTVFDIANTSLTSDDLQIIAEFSNLERLTMDASRLTETMTRTVADLAKLQALKLRNLPSDFEPGHLARFPLLSELYVDADDSAVFDDDFWQAIAGLKELHILMCKGVTDESLAEAWPTPQVEVLIVMSRVVTGEAFVKSMQKFPNVKSLTVNYSDWTDNDVQQLHGLKSLGKLDVTKNSASVEAIKALSVALPKCQIISDHGTFEPTKSE